METLDFCPVCNAGLFEPFLICKDYTVSREDFQIVRCKSCGFAFTNPRPLPKELGKYYKSEEYISHTDTRKGLVNSLYHLVRKYTLIKKLQSIVRLCGRPSKINPRSILDIGSGTGVFLDICTRAGFSCIGIEPDQDARTSAMNSYGLDIREETELDNMTKKSFDVITLWHVLEHVPFLNERIIQLKELLKPTGIVIVAVPNRSSFDAKYYEKFWAAYDLPRHLYHFTPKDIRQLFDKHGMKIERILPMRFDSFYVSMLSERYKRGKINYLSAVMIGLKSNLKAIRNGSEFSSQVYVIKNR